MLFYLGVSPVAEANPVVLGTALAFSAGTFLCIAAADLLPELQFHSHDRVKLSAALLAGIALAVLFGALEGASHGHSHEGAEYYQHAGLPIRAIWLLAFFWSLCLQLHSTSWQLY